jgi:galactokinase/mevalonate kinase-like predicted kinase
MRTVQASAPGRCGIIGNPSDIYGGVVVSCAIEPRNSCRLVLDGLGRRPDDLRLWEAAVARFPLNSEWSVEWRDEVPRSSGLSGSTALLAATLLCVLEVLGEAPALSASAARVAFAELVRDVERHDAGIACGFQDAYMIVHGGLQRMDFAGKDPAEQALRRPGPAGSISALEGELPFLLVTTGVERLSGSVHGPMVERWLRGEAAVRDGMTRVGELGRLGASAYGRSDWAGLAELMRENHRIVAGLGGSGEAIDALVSACEAEGALAAKLAGAGLGGTVIALAEDLSDLEARLRERGYSRFTRPALAAGVRLEPAA